MNIISNSDYWTPLLLLLFHSYCGCSPLGNCKNLLYKITCQYKHICFITPSFWFFAQFRKIQLKGFCSLKSVLVTVAEGNGSRCPWFVHYCCNPQRFHVCFVKPYGLVATWGPRDAHLTPRAMLIQGPHPGRHPQDHSRETKQFLLAFQWDLFRLRHEGFVHKFSWCSLGL